MHCDISWHLPWHTGQLAILEVTHEHTYNEMGIF